MTNVDLHWFTRRDGTWSVRVRAHGLSPEGEVIDTGCPGLYSAQIAAARHIADAVQIGAAWIASRRAS